MWIDPPGLVPSVGQGAQPKVSVVMPTYRRPEQVGVSLRTLLAQTLRDFELLVRDDGDGTDGTEEAVRAAANGDPRVRYHRNPKNLRMPANLNGGIEASRGQYIAVCHDHDLYRTDYLEALAQLLDRHPTALFAHCGLENIDHSGQVLHTHVGEWAELTDGPAWLERMFANLSCPVSALSMVRRSAHERYGLYNPLCGFIADVELWFRLSENGDVAYAARPLIQVMEREAQHDATMNPWPILANMLSIHRHYLYRRHAGGRRAWREARLSWRGDVSIAREVLARVKRRNWKGFGASAGALAEAAGPVGRLLVATLS